MLDRVWNPLRPVAFGTPIAVTDSSEVVPVIEVVALGATLEAAIARAHAKTRAQAPQATQTDLELTVIDVKTHESVGATPPVFAVKCVGKLYLQR